MSIPASYIETLRDRVSIAETIERRISFDPKKSVPGKGDYWACCPFHGEKTPSFHVLDRQGYFYCFGCHEKGSAIDFVMKHDRLSFPEAVERLALEAGMAPPVKDKREAKREAKRATLSEVTEAAAVFFREQLDSAAGSEARRYLTEKRGLTQETIERFEIGYAPDSWEAAYRALSAQGFDQKLLIAADICAASDRGRDPYDRFRDRIMFPIRDLRGRCVGFGGRAMRPGEKTAKYLNSRETELFKKGETLYNLGRVRDKVSEERPLLVAEGYMDVIGLAQAGYETAVAPLGTALTENQLKLLWKVAAEPVLALDGDEAGHRAAERAAHLALPLLAAGRSLGFASLPPGQDPDDLARTGGPMAVDALIAEAEPLIDLLWRRSIAQFRGDTPERRAALEKDHLQIVDKIEDKTVGRRYRDAFYERRRQFFWSLDRENRDAAFKAGKNKRSRATEEARVAALAMATRSADPLVVREGAILLLLLQNPGLWDLRGGRAEELEFTDPTLDNMKNALLSGFAAIDDQGRLQNRDQTEERLDPAARHEALTQYVDERCGSGACRELCDSLKSRLGGPFSNPPQSLQAVCRLFDEVARLHGAQLTERREKEAYNAELLDPDAKDEAPLRVQEAQKRMAISQDALTMDEEKTETGGGGLSALVEGEIWRKQRKGGQGGG